MLEIQNVSFSFSNQLIIDKLALDLPSGKHLAVLGESGSGKSTLLKLIYGIYDCQEGQIVFDNQKIKGPKQQLIPGHPNIKYVPQDFELNWYATVAENIGTFLSYATPTKRNEIIADLLHRFDLTDVASKRAIDLSGGQKQRTALAKSLAINPKLLLLDEPFSNIDTARRNPIRRALFDYASENQIAVILATHDPDDALAFTDFTLILHRGKALQFGSSFQVYNAPKTPTVAALYSDFTLFRESDSTREIIVYPHEFSVVPQSNIQVVVKNCYQQRSQFLVQAHTNQGEVFFYSQTPFQPNTILCLEVHPDAQKRWQPEQF
ncbi:ABC transporter ATP-binding protein [Flavobacterium aurantiibacter]|uniref:ABC transporter domain-containing protein n=1 Tax=Flavobacterium aurantiibacter TaxID=2023067 RepID=A0A256A7Z2_9FLAO|nr:ABC transporter ATP-binding protein [Flavobacterium aurantiibacter]OYQ49250.1 hypothetical protein CHX27_01555 [Flavobacterium aurantiibacter]